MPAATGDIAFQGEPGAYSALSCKAAYPDLTPRACPTFDDAFRAVEEGRATLAMIPVENSVAGRVADIHHLLPGSSLHIVAEHFEPVRHCLMAPPGTTLDAVTHVHSHPQALAQCRRLITQRGWTAMRELDTAGAARMVAAAAPDAAMGAGAAAIASQLAAEIYGLEILARDIQDDPDNTTRFIVMAREPATPPRDTPVCMTSFIFRVRNVSAALYKALGGFATNGVNMTKLESYQIDGGFTATQFYADVEGRPDEPQLAAALEELQFFSSRLRIVGTYPAHAYRRGRSLRS